MKVRFCIKGLVLPVSLYFFFLLLSGVFTSFTEVQADEIEFQTGITQSNFKKFSKDLGSALSYKALAPAEPLGILGFEVGLDITTVDINQGKDYWEQATKEDDMPGLLPVPKVYLKKGLPFKIDVGALYSEVPDSNIALWGAEVKYSILEGSIATPAVAVRATYTELRGVDELNLRTYGGDVSISKGFMNLTPYAGIGLVRVSSDPKRLALPIHLDKEEFTLTRYFGGIRFTVLLFHVTAEVEYMEVPSYSLRTGIIF